MNLSIRGTAMIHGSASMVVAADRNDDDQPRFQFPKQLPHTFLASCLTCRMFREKSSSLLEFIQSVESRGNAITESLANLLGSFTLIRPDKFLRAALDTPAYGQPPKHLFVGLSDLSIALFSLCV
jgi:hypothetical protein